MFELFKQAYNLKPSSSQSQIIYTIGALYIGRADIVREMMPLVGEEAVITDNRFLKVYSDIGDYNTVIKILKTRIERDPSNLQNKLSLASAYASIGQKSIAISLIREIIAQQPSFKEQGEYYIQQINAQ